MASACQGQSQLTPSRFLHNRSYVTMDRADRTGARRLLQLRGVDRVRSLAWGNLPNGEVWAVAFAPVPELRRCLPRYWDRRCGSPQRKSCGAFFSDTFGHWCIHQKAWWGEADIQHAMHRFAIHPFGCLLAFTAIAAVVLCSANIPPAGGPEIALLCEFWVDW